MHTANESTGPSQVLEATGLSQTKEASGVSQGWRQGGGKHEKKEKKVKKV